MYILISLEEESDFDDIYEPLVEDQQQDNLDDEELIKVKYQMKKPKMFPSPIAGVQTPGIYRKSLKSMLALVKEKLEKILKVTLPSLISSSCLLLKLS